ncbi:MAG TPA: PH domain-containing protein [Candidatus Thermoplasmatota archaeon]|nr:PH domain-containing protein [Candidatus Thermoplasmatota archaeon]
MGAPYFYLREDEAVLVRVRPPLTYALVLLAVPTLVLSVLLALALFILPRAFGMPPAVPWTAWGALVALVVLASWRRAATTEYALTEERVYARSGRLVTRLHFTTHDKVTDMRFRQGPLERLFGLSTLTFATAGGEVHLAGVRDAMALKAAAERARDAFIRRLLAETAAAAPPPAAPAPEPPASGADAAPPPPHPVAFEGPRPAYLQAGDTPVWSARPRLIAALGALRSVLGLIPLVLFSNFMQGPQRLYIPIAATGLVLMFIAVRFMQLRRTEYLATERRVYARQGLVGTTVNQLTYDKITDIAFHQDILGRVLGYGSVTLQTAGSNQAPITMIGLADPLAAKEAIERWRDAAVGASR